jgi:hypothetical protein
VKQEVASAFAFGARLEGLRYINKIAIGTRYLPRHRREVFMRCVFGLLLLGLTLSPVSALAAPGDTIIGPVPLKSRPTCLTFMIRRANGQETQFWVRGRQFVTGGGNCPAGYLAGYRVNATQIDITDTDGRVFRCDIEHNTCNPR